MQHSRGVATMLGGALVAGAVGAFGGPLARPTPMAQAAPTWNIDFNASGYNIERGACVSVKLGANAATECGDLRVTHELPAVRIFNTRLAPTLVYNSAHAHPVVSIPLVITLAATTTRPDSVQVIVSRGASPTSKTPRDTLYWSGADWPAGVTATRRVTATWDAMEDTTGVYFQDVEVANIYPGNVRIPNTTTYAGSAIVVNRRKSPFGAGWWLAGLEQVKPTIPAGTTPQYLWIGGDGSARVFMPPYALSYDRLDSLVWNAATQVWTRWLPEGRRVEFNATGQHLRTINRFGRTTTYAYATTSPSAVLQSISLPAPTNLLYTFTYANPGSRLSQVTAPYIGATARTTQVTTQASDSTLRSLRNPGDSLVRFAYETSSVAKRYLMLRRTDRRGVHTTFTYDSAFKARTSTISPGPGAAPIVWTVRAGESRGLPRDGTPAAVDTMQTGTRIDGPRTDVSDTTTIFQERFGSPRRIVDASGATTHLRRRYLQSWFGYDEGWLLWRLERPVGTTAAPETHVQRYVYEYPRGNITVVKDSGSAASVPADSTLYEWDQSFDQLKKVTPMLGNTMEYGINATNGRREWQQDARGLAARINYYYDEGSYPEQVNRIVLPATALNTAATYTYAYLTPLRNTYTETTPRSLVTTYTPDPIGRITLIESPIDSLASSIRRVQRRMAYSLRDELLGDTTQSVNVTPSEAAFVRNYYDAEGARVRVDRWASPDPRSIGTMVLRWRVDSAGRPVAAEAVDGQKDSVVYDPAGNVVKAINRRFVASTVDSTQYLTMTYDALNRVLQRRIPAYQYSSRTEGIGGGQYPGQPPYPAYSIPEDVQSYVYDQAGAIKQALNRYGQVGRGYLRGRLVSDTLRVADVAAASFAQHVYVTQYRYDVEGRRSVLKYPSQLVAAGQDSLRYSYNYWNSDLGGVIDPQGNTWAYTYDQRDQLTDLYNYSSQLRQMWKYDNEGNVVLDSVYTAVTGFPRYLSNYLRRTLLSYDGRGKVLRAVAPAIGAKDTLLSTYSGLGYLTDARTIQRAVANIASDSVRYGSSEQTSYDGLGNIVSSSVRDTTRRWGTNGGTSYSPVDRNVWYKPLVGRDTASLSSFALPRYTKYDAAGNVVFSTKAPGSLDLVAEDRASFYDPAGQLVAADRRLVSTPAPAWNQNALEEYRYDALGRRIWVRAQRSCWADGGNPPPSGRCVATFIRRVVWDGQQEIAEIQVPGAASQSAAHEDDLGPYNVPPVSGWDINPYFGRVIYSMGRDVDRPVAVARYGYTDIPNLASPSYVVWPTFVLMPAWDVRGQAALGVYSDGAAYRQYTPGGTKCSTAVPQTAQRCVLWEWQWFNGAYNSQRGRYLASWQGSLLEDKLDAAETYYRRNRSYDPSTGRFTQEDPIGLAGGLNLYGYAGGDPVNFSDPFGLFELRIIGDDQFKRDIAARRAQDAEVDAAFKELEDSESLYVIAQRPGSRGGLTLGGRAASPGLPNEQDLVDSEAAALGIVDRQVRGISFVGQRPPTPPSWIAGHEAIHLLGIERRGQKYAHREQAFESERWKFWGRLYPWP